MVNKVNFLGHEVTRLIVGDNPMNGHSYIEDSITGLEMKKYYTAERIKATFKHIEEQGINGMLPLADPYITRLLWEYQNQGGNLKLIWQPYPPIGMDRSIRIIPKSLDTIGSYHQGTTTDLFFEKQDFDTIKENLKKMHETGKPVGLGTHYPEIIERSEEEGWEVDFYVACLQNARRGREGEESGFITGKEKQGLVFYPEDRPIMLNTLRKVNKPIVAFKIFAGGQMFEGKDENGVKEAIKGAYDEVFSALKPDDIAAIGVFQRDKDQIKQNIEIYNEWYNEKYNNSYGILN